MKFDKDIIYDDRFRENLYPETYKARESFPSRVIMPDPLITEYEFEMQPEKERLIPFEELLRQANGDQRIIDIFVMSFGLRSLASAVKTQMVDQDNNKCAQAKQRFLECQGYFDKQFPLVADFLEHLRINTSRGVSCSMHPDDIIRDIFWEGSNSPLVHLDQYQLLEDFEHYDPNRL